MPCGNIRLVVSNQVCIYTCCIFLCFLLNFPFQTYYPAIYHCIPQTNFGGNFIEVYIRQGSIFLLYPQLFNINILVTVLLKAMSISPCNEVIKERSESLRSIISQVKSPTSQYQGDAPHLFCPFDIGQIIFRP